MNLPLLLVSYESENFLIYEMAHIIYKSSPQEMVKTSRIKSMSLDFESLGRLTIGGGLRTVTRSWYLRLVRFI